MDGVLHKHMKLEARDGVGAMPVEKSAISECDFLLEVNKQC